ncbi:MAG: hypothetical protein JJU36_12790 [Phycisphaeraceae bacterium]|nr:hypothetical protein [Phycisphaeraceae bacterium]
MIDESGENLGLCVSSTVDEVIASWRLVYDAYVRVGLIHQNPHHIHMAPQAIGPGTAVLSSSIGIIPVSTLTAITDDPSREGAMLPLDRVYGPQLQRLRSKGHRLMEVGLFADRRRHLSRTTESLFQFMRLAFYFGLSRKITDFVIGVHPRHARFYSRFFGFMQEDDVKSYNAVNDHPVVLLRGNLESEMAKRPLHPALDYFVANPPEKGLFNDRFDFQPTAIAGTPIDGWLRDYYGKVPMAKAG